jgi:hypothetical protein
VLSFGGDFVDDVESADGGVVASFDLEPGAGSDGVAADAVESESFESGPFSPVRT